ncbi:MAG TPA: hypothetical protein VIM13_08670 [Clostridia bacterium]
MVRNPKARSRRWYAGTAAITDIFPSSAPLLSDELAEEAQEQMMTQDLQ